jgi:Zn-dependent protease with chaperone function
MPLLLLLFLTLVCLPDSWSPPFWQPATSGHTTAVSAALTWLAVTLVVGFARGIAANVTGCLGADPAQRERVLRRYGRLRTYHVFALIGTYAAALYLLGWGWTVQQLWRQGDWELPGAEVLLLAPFLIGLVLSWVAFYDAERSLHATAESEGAEADIQHAKGLAAVGFNDHAETAPASPFWSRGAYVAFHVRQNFALVFAPLVLLIVMKGLHRIIPEAEEGKVTFVGIALPIAVFVGLPWLLRLALGLKPLPPGELRDRLEAAARRLRFRHSDILVWNTRGGVANAMVAGIVPWVRYVLLTDRLMSDLTPDEVEAVFGHEIGHVKHHHMLYYLAFLLGSLFLVGGLLFGLLAPYLPFGMHPNKISPPQALLLVTTLGTYIFTVFGFLSRRCERQADVYGCRAVSCARPGCCGHTQFTELAPRGRGLCPTGIRTFIEALEKVARLNGISRDNPGWLSSWQHSTIARRVEFLQDVLRDPAVERRFQWRVALVKWGLLLGLLAALAVLLVANSKGHESEEASPSAGDETEVVMPHTAEHTAPSE